MQSTQPVVTDINEPPISLEDFEGASFRFSLPTRSAEMHSRRNDENWQDRNRPPPVVDHQEELAKLLNSFSGRHSHWQVFSDFCEMGAIAFSNVVDLTQREKREERYMQISKGYSREELHNFSKGLSLLTKALESDFSDVLGHTFHYLGLHNKWAGQFFTPYSLSRMIANMTVGDGEDLKARIAERGFVTAQEPAVGSGSMVIALAQAVRDAGVNYQQHLHVTAIDVDLKCVHMAYLQLTLLHIPAVIVHGNTLSLEEYSRWYTPAHMMGGWDWKLRHQSEEMGEHEIHAPPKIEAATVENLPEQKPDLPRGQMPLF